MNFITCYWTGWFCGISKYKELKIIKPQNNNNCSSKNNSKLWQQRLQIRVLHMRHWFLHQLIRWWQYCPMSRLILKSPGCSTRSAGDSEKCLLQIHGNRDSLQFQSSLLTIFNLSEDIIILTSLFFMWRDGYLCYFDTESLLELGVNNRGDFDNSKARGKLDLKSSQFKLIVDQIEGAPFNFCIQLLFPNNTEEK